MGSEEQSEAVVPKKRRRILRKVLLAFVLVLAGALVWLNGPGWRWIAPKVVEHFLAQTGMRAEFALEGRLTGGIAVRDLRLESDSTLAGLTAQRVELEYRFREIVRGRLDGVILDGVHVELGLEEKGDGVEVVEEETERKALDLEGLVATLRSVREVAIPVSVRATNFRLDVTRSGRHVFSLAESSVLHVAGDPAIDLRVGEITDASGKVWPAGESEILWNEDDITINRLEPLPGVGVEELVLRLPESGGPSVSAELALDDAVFAVEVPEGLQSVSFSLREGELDSAPLLERFGLDVPVEGKLRSLALTVEGVMPEPLLATGSVQLLLEDVAYEEWEVAELGLDVDLESDGVRLTARAVALGTEVLVDADASLKRSKEEFLPLAAEGSLQVAGVSELVENLGEVLEAWSPEGALPKSSLDGTFELAFSGWNPEEAEAELRLKPADPEAVTPIRVGALWKADEERVDASAELEGLALEASYDLGEASYHGKLDVSEFRTEVVEPWLAVAGVELPGVVALDAAWNGAGEISDGVHKGKLELAELSWQQEDAAEIQAMGVVDYDWPTRVAASGLQVKTSGQTVVAEIKLEDQMVHLDGFRWQDKDVLLGGGSAKIPVPEDFSKWREMLAEDERPLEVALETEVLPLRLLGDVVPTVREELNEQSTGKVMLRVSGNYSAPELDAVVELKQVGTTKKPDLPLVDLRLTLGTREGNLLVNGVAKTPEYPPVTAEASMAFRPSEWAKDPELVMNEGVSARVELPQLQLERFRRYVPQVKKLEGVLSGHVEVGGVVKKPELKGRVALTGGGVVLKSDQYPDVSGLGFSMDLGTERVTLNDLKATVAGGTLRGGGEVVLVDFLPDKLDFSIRGDHLPVVRNDSMIVRANLDLRLAGAWETAALTGSVGVVDSLFYRDIELIPMGKPFTGPSVASLPKVDVAKGTKAGSALPEPFGAWGLNVDVRTDTPFLIRGNIAKGRVDVALKVGGTIGKPAPDGEVKIANMQASLPFTTLQVKDGLVRFTPSRGLDPVIEIRGTAEPRPYRVNVYAYGSATSPQLVLTSNPPLPENEIMTLLATGTTTSGLEDPQAASSRGMQLLLEEFRRGRLPLGKQLRPVLGLLDNVDFSVAEEDPFTSEQYSTATFFLSDRVYFTAGMGETGESRVLGFWRYSFK